MKNYKITRKQLDEIINSDLMFSTDPTPEYAASDISTTEPVGDDNYGDIVTTDDKSKNMLPSPLSRMTNAGNYGGPVIY